MPGLRLLLADLLVAAHCRVHGDDGSSVAFGLWERQAQISIVGTHDLHVPVLQSLQVTGPYKAVEHEGNRPSQVGRHALFGHTDFVVGAYRFCRRRVLLTAHMPRRSNNFPVLAGRECAARGGDYLDLRKLRHFHQHPHRHAMLQDLAHRHQVLADGGGAKALTQKVRKL